MSNIDHRVKTQRRLNFIDDTVALAMSFRAALTQVEVPMGRLSSDYRPE
jgi:hypothetical protein